MGRPSAAAVTELEEDIINAMRGDRAAIGRVHTEIRKVVAGALGKKYQGRAATHDVDLAVAESIDRMMGSCKNPGALVALVRKDASDAILRLIREPSERERQMRGLPPIDTTLVKKAKASARERALAAANVTTEVVPVTNRGTKKAVTRHQVSLTKIPTVEVSDIEPGRASPRPTGLSYEDDDDLKIRDAADNYEIRPWPEVVALVVGYLTDEAVRVGRLLPGANPATLGRPRRGIKSPAANKEQTLAFLACQWQMSAEQVREVASVHPVVLALVGTFSDAELHNARSRAADRRPSLQLLKFRAVY